MSDIQPDNAPNPEPASPPARWARMWRRALVAALAAAGLAALALPGWVRHVTFYEALNNHSMALIDETLERDLRIFGVLSAVKAGLAVVEDSSVGVGFQLEVGDLVQPAYDYIDTVWDLFLYALLVLGFYKLLLETGFLGLGIPVMGAGCLIWAAGLLRADWREGALVLARRLVLGGLLFSYTVPVALIGADALDQAYTERLRVHQEERLDAFLTELEGFKREFVALKDRISLTNPTASLEALKDGIVGIATSMGASARAAIPACLYLLLLILFELLFFPFLTAALLYKVLQLASDELLRRAGTLTLGGRATPTPG